MDLGVSVALTERKNATSTAPNATDLVDPVVPAALLLKHRRAREEANRPKARAREEANRQKEREEANRPKARAKEEANRQRGVIHMAVVHPVE